MPKQDWKTIISKLEKEIIALHGEIRKREEIVKNLKSLQGISGLVIPVRRGRRPRAWAAGRKPVVRRRRRRVGRPGRPGRPARRGRPGPKPGMVRRGRRRVGRTVKMPKTADIMVEILAKMPQPAAIDELAEKLHSLHPKLGGVKYRSVVASITSRDSRFEKMKGNKVALKSKA